MISAESVNSVENYFFEEKIRNLFNRKTFFVNLNNSMSRDFYEFSMATSSTLLLLIGLIRENIC